MNTDIRRLTFFERAFIAISTLWVVVFLVSYMGVELKSWRAQNLAEFIFWLAPLVLFVMASRIRPSNWRSVSMIASGLLVAISVMPASCSGFDVLALGDGPVDLSFEPISREAFGQTELALYRTNCGAICSFGLVLIQERNFASGIRVARVLGRWEPANSAVVRVASPELIYVELAPYGESRIVTEVHNLKVSRSFLW